MSIKVEISYKEVPTSWVILYTTGGSLEAIKSSGKLGLQTIHWIRYPDGRMYNCQTREWKEKEKA